MGQDRRTEQRRAKVTAQMCNLQAHLSLISLPYLKCQDFMMLMNMVDVIYVDVP